VRTGSGRLWTARTAENVILLVTARSVRCATEHQSVLQLQGILEFAGGLLVASSQDLFTATTQRKICRFGCWCILEAMIFSDITCQKLRRSIEAALSCSRKPSGRFLGLMIYIPRKSKNVTFDSCKFTAESAGERILKIGQHLAKLSASVECPIFDWRDILATPQYSAVTTAGTA